MLPGSAEGLETYETAPSAVRHTDSPERQQVARLPPKPSRLSEGPGLPLLARVSPGAIAATTLRPALVTHFIAGGKAAI
jgi:hypothetical protein